MDVIRHLPQAPGGAVDELAGGSVDEPASGIACKPADVKPADVKLADVASTMKVEEDRLAARIVRDVRRLTRGGVADLEVQVRPDGVWLKGRCSTFYCKQLAQHAAMESAGAARLVNEIEVW